MWSRRNLPTFRGKVGTASTPYKSKHVLPKRRYISTRLRDVRPTRRRSSMLFNHPQMVKEKWHKLSVNKTWLMKFPASGFQINPYRKYLVISHHSFLWRQGKDSVSSLQRYRQFSHIPRFKAMRFASAAYLCRGVAGGWSPPSGSQPCEPARPTAASSVLVPAGHSANTKHKDTHEWICIIQQRITEGNQKLVSYMERASSLSWLFTSVNSITARDYIKVNANVKCKLHTVIIVSPHSGTTLRPPTLYKFKKLIFLGSPREEFCMRWHSNSYNSSHRRDRWNTSWTWIQAHAAEW